MSPYLLMRADPVCAALLAIVDAKIRFALEGTLLGGMRPYSAHVLRNVIEQEQHEQVPCSTCRGSTTAPSPRMPHYICAINCTSCSVNYCPAHLYDQVVHNGVMVVFCGPCLLDGVVRCNHCRRLVEFARAIECGICEEITYGTCGWYDVPTPVCPDLECHRCFREHDMDSCASDHGS